MVCVRTKMTTYFEMINVVERVFRMQDELPSLREEIATATVELEKAEGLKKTVARCKLRDAETALAAKISEINILGTSIPSPDEVPCARAIEHIALLRTTRESQVKAVERAKSRLDEVNRKSQSGSWRPKGALPPLGVLHAQKEVAIIEGEIAETDRTIASHMRDVAAAEEERLADAEMDEWLYRDGPRPRVLVERDRLEWEEFMRNAIRLPLRRTQLKNPITSK